MLNLQYLTDPTGTPNAVVIPIDLWRQIFPEPTTQIDPEDFTEAIEDYCLHQAMLEAAETPLLDRSSALAYLEVAPGECFQSGINS
jgi:hypothetical protein